MNSLLSLGIDVNVNAVRLLIDFKRIVMSLLVFMHQKNAKKGELKNRQHM